MIERCVLTKEENKEKRQIAYEEKKDNKYFLMNLPTGSGKSLLAIMIANWYMTKVNPKSKVDIATPGKILQDQYDETFESISNLKGKENYECKQYACSCAQGIEFNKLNKTECSICPYTAARSGYIGGNISLTNFHLYLIYALYAPDMLEQRGSKLLIVDECHLIDSVMSDFISVKITETSIKRLRLPDEDKILSDLKSIKNIKEYIDFLSVLNTILIETIDIISGAEVPRKDNKFHKRKNIISSVQKKKSKEVDDLQVISDIKQLISKISIFLDEYTENPDNWVMEVTYNEKIKQSESSLEPIWAYDYLDKYVWSKYDHVIFMSGTILSKRIFSHLNGIDEDKSVYYSISSPFDMANRRIFYIPMGKMSYTKKEETFNNYIPFIKKLLSKYKDKKGIIHTNSFELSNWIKRDIEDNRLLFHDSSNKEEMLNLHFKNENPTVIVSPSLTTGVSFDDDLARFQIICKCPFPNLGSIKNKMRQKTNPEWYNFFTIIVLIQIIGRIVRSNRDYGDTIIIDGSFGDILKYNEELIPGWIKQSIKKIEMKIE